MDFEKLKIKDYKKWSVYLHQNQYYLGRAYIWAKREDDIDFMQISFQESEELFDIGRAVNKALSDLFQPDLMNYAILGNVTNRLHVHVIPRYKSPRIFSGIKFVDERWGKNYAPYNYDFKIPEPILLEIRDAVKEKL